MLTDDEIGKFYRDNNRDIFAMSKAIEAHLMQGQEPVAYLYTHNGRTRQFISRTQAHWPDNTPPSDLIITPLFTAPPAQPDEWLNHGATQAKVTHLQERGFTQVGIVMCDDAGKRAIIDMGKVTWPNVEQDEGFYFAISHTDQGVNFIKECGLQSGGDQAATRANSSDEAGAEQAPKGE